MGIRATFHTIMHYNSQLQLSGWRVLTKTVQCNSRQNKIGEKIMSDIKQLQ